MGSFEDSLKKSFQNKELKAPNSVWDQVQNDLNADFVQAYQSRQAKYKLVAAAAVLLAFCSFAIHYYPLFESNSGEAQSYSGEVYNALLTDDANDFYTYPQAGYSSPIFRGFMPSPASQGSTVSKGRSRIGTSVPESESNHILFAYANLSSVNTEVEEAIVYSDIYPYHQGGSYSSLSKSRDSGDKGLWAGVEAGAGNFSSSMGSSNVFAGSINQSSLASALGSDGFVNPSSRVNPDLNNGIVTSLGLDLGMRVGKKWTFETGIMYSNVNARGDATINVLDIYTIDNSEFIGSGNDTDVPLPTLSSRETALEVQDSYNYDVDLKSNLRFTSVPLKAGYFLVDKKMSLRLNIGLAANYFMGSQVKADNNVLDGSLDGSFNSWSFDGLGGFEIGYSIFNNFDVTFEPNYRQSITPLTNSNESESRFLVQTGLRYIIQ